MKTFYFLALVFFGAKLNAQPPAGDDALMSIKGKWTTGEKINETRDATVKANQVPFIYKKLDSIALLFTKAYPVPTATEAKWFGYFGQYRLFDMAPVPYSYWSQYKLYYYNKNLKKIMLGDETYTWAYVFVNHFQWFLNDAKLEWNGNKILERPRLLTEKWKGIAVYEAYKHSPNAKAVVVTKSDRMPWKPISRLQYLQALKIKTEDDYKKMLTDFDARINEGRKTIEKLRNSKDFPPATKQNMVTIAQQQLDNNIGLRDGMAKKAEALKTKDLQIIDEVMAQNSKEELQQDAIINRNKSFLSYKRFEEAANKDAAWMVFIDRSFFDTTLPAHAPQFMVVYWRWSNDGPSLFFKKMFEENFAADKLKAMLKN